MPSPIINTQALFPYKSVLTYGFIDPSVPTKMAEFDNYNIIYTDISTYGTIITRIRITSTAAIGEYVTSKMIYLGFLNVGEKKESLYKTAYMEADFTLSHKDRLPYVEFTFGNGLLIQGNSIIIGASESKGTTTEAGDYIYYVVEGGRYDKE
jgi:hypothetical protein